MSSDLTFITNQEGNILRERLSTLLAHTAQFDVLVGNLERSENAPGGAITARS